MVRTIGIGIHQFDQIIEHNCFYVDKTIMLRKMVYGWFTGNLSDYNDFVKALLLGDLDAMNEYIMGSY